MLFFIGHGAPEAVLNAEEIVPAEAIGVNGVTVEVLIVDWSPEDVVAAELLKVVEVTDVAEAGGPEVLIGTEESEGPTEKGRHCSGNLYRFGSFQRSLVHTGVWSSFFFSVQALMDKSTPIPPSSFTPKMSRLFGQTPAESGCCQYFLLPTLKFK